MLLPSTVQPIFLPRFCRPSVTPRERLQLSPITLLVDGDRAEIPYVEATANLCAVGNVYPVAHAVVMQQHCYVPDSELAPRGAARVHKQAQRFAQPVWRQRSEALSARHFCELIRRSFFK
jgi:hypothetical protein